VAALALGADEELFNLGNHRTESLMRFIEVLRVRGRGRVRVRVGPNPNHRTESLVRLCASLR